MYMEKKLTKIKYIEIHKWLSKNYGKAAYCSNEKCQFVSPKRFEWALKTGKEHGKDISLYISLCPSCHRKYDKANVGVPKSEKHREFIKTMNKKPVVSYTK